MLQLQSALHAPASKATVATTGTGGQSKAVVNGKGGQAIDSSITKKNNDEDEDEAGAAAALKSACPQAMTGPVKTGERSLTTPTRTTCHNSPTATTTTAEEELMLSGSSYESSHLNELMKKVRKLFFVLVFVELPLARSLA